MPQGSHMKGGKTNPKKPKITKVSKKGCGITKKTAKTVTEKNKLKKVLEKAIKANIESDVRLRAGGSGFSFGNKDAPKNFPAKKKVGKKGKKK